MKKVIITFVALSVLPFFVGCGHTGASTPGQQTSQLQNVKSITEDEAKSIALNHAKVSENDAIFVQVKLDAEGVRKEYDIEFYADKKEYDYEIDAVTGDILSFDSDAEYYDSLNTQQIPAAGITEAEAKQTALAYAGVKESDILYLNVRFEYDDGRALYDVEFHVGRTEYNCEVDAVTGDIIDFDMDGD